MEKELESYVLPGEKSNVDWKKNDELLDRAALKSALDALERLNSSSSNSSLQDQRKEMKSRDASTLAKLDVSTTGDTIKEPDNDDDVNLCCYCQKEINESHPSLDNDHNDNEQEDKECRCSP